MNKNMYTIINEVNSHWSKDLIIRYLYIKLAPFFRRDLLFFLATEEERFRQYQLGFINRFPEIVCSTLADFYVNLYNQFGIQAQKVVATSSKIPLFAIIASGDEGPYFLDPISDLFYNQYGLRPYNFGIIPRYKTINREHPELVKIPKSYIDELDKDLGIPPFLNDHMNYLHHELANRDRVYTFFGLNKNAVKDLRDIKLQFYNDNLINIGHVYGTFERAQLYNYLNGQILNHGERKYVRVKIISENSQPFIRYEIIRKEGIITYDEQKKDNQFVLIKQ